MIGCALDQDGCMDLLAILRIMNQVDQEQAWAIAYEFAALMQRLWPAGNCALIDNLAQIYIHRDGFIHEKSLYVASVPADAIELLQLRDASKQQQQQKQNQKGTSRRASIATTVSQEHQLERKVETEETNFSTTRSTSSANGTPTEETKSSTTAASKLQQSQQQQQLPPSPPITPELNETQRRRPALTESELVASLGKALFWVLDFGIADDEERKLSEPLEYLISQSQYGLSLTELLDICRKRLSVATKTQADLHYRDVCKSLVSETIKLSIFLDKIYTATMVLRGANLSTSHHHHGITEDNCDKILSQATDLHLESHHLHDLHHNHHHHHHNQHLNDQHGHSDHFVHHHVVHPNDLSELSLPLASLKVLGISEWARLWMRVINELRQRGKLK